MAPQLPAVDVLIDIREALDTVTDAIADTRTGDTVTTVEAARFRSHRAPGRNLHGTVRVIVDFGPDPAAARSAAQLVHDRLVEHPQLEWHHLEEPREYVAYLRPRDVD